MNKKMAWLAAGGGVFVSAAALAVFLSSRGSGLEALAKEYRTSGMPWTIADFSPAKKTEIPDSENAAFLIRKAMKAWPRTSGVMQPVDRSEPKNKKEAQELLDKAENLLPALKLAMEASRKPHYEPGWDWDRDLNKVVPEVHSMWLMVTALCQRSGALLTLGKTDEALEAWQAALNLTLLARTVTDSSASLLASAMSASTSGTAVKALSRAPKNKEVLKTIVEGLERLDEEPDWHMTVKTDGYAYLAVFRSSRDRDDAAARLQAGYKEDPKSSLDRNGIPSSPGVEEMTSGFLKAYAKLGRALKSENASLADMILLAEKLEDEAGSGGSRRSPSSLSRSLRRIGASMGHAKSARALALVLSEKLLMDRDVRSLDQLRGDSWIDPLSGLPLKFTHHNGKVKVWSIGANLADEGGLTREESRAAARYQSSSAFTLMSFDEVAAFPDLSLAPGRLVVAPPSAFSDSSSLSDGDDATVSMAFGAGRSIITAAGTGYRGYAPGYLGVRRSTGLEGAF